MDGIKYVGRVLEKILIAPCLVLTRCAARKMGDLGTHKNRISLT